MQDWITNCANLYLLRIMQSEVVQHGTPCSACQGPSALFQCRDCLPLSVLCQSCITRLHRCIPTHRFRRWTGSYFESITSRDLGLVFHLGHAGAECNLGQDQDFLLCDSNGFHHITLRFCRHPGHGDPARQLLECQIFPSSDQRPATGFTFSVLRLYTLLESEGKLATKRFYDVLVYLTNPIFPHQVRDRYRELLRVSRQWIYLDDLKHSNASESSLQHAELALRCPCCPRLGVNFSKEDVIESNRSAHYLHTVHF
jgi:hypothetical protein